MKVHTLQKIDLLKRLISLYQRNGLSLFRNSNLFSSMAREEREIFAKIFIIKQTKRFSTESTEKFINELNFSFGDAEDLIRFFRQRLDKERENLISEYND